MHSAGDAEGVETIPLRMLIVAVVAAMSIAPASEALEALQDREFLRKADAQLGMVVACAEVVYIQGAGGARTVSLDFSSGSGTIFLRLLLGDALGGPAAACALIEFSTGAVMTAISDMPGLWVCGPNGESFESTTPVFDLRISAMMSEGVLCIVAEESLWTT